MAQLLFLRTWFSLKPQVPAFLTSLKYNTVRELWAGETYYTQLYCMWETKITEREKRDEKT